MEDDIERFGPKLELLGQTKVGPMTVLAFGGSVLDYHGDAIVNAANTGGITGFGVDEQINRAGGNELKEARKAFGGIPTGTCKSTTSFQHTSVKWIIHAVGPVLRENAMSKESLGEKMNQLTAAYKNSLIEASRLNCHDIGFCLLSCGVFRGSVPMETCISHGLRGVYQFYQRSLWEDTQILPSCIGFVAYTKEEQTALKSVIENAQLDNPT